MKNLTFNQLQLRLLALLFALFTGAVFGYRYFVELPKLEQSIAQLSEREIYTLRSSIRTQLDSLSRINFDYAVWTDTYHFMREQNEDYIEHNFVDNTFTSLKVDGFFYLDAQLKPILTKGVHHRTLKELSFSFFDFEKNPNNTNMLPTETAGKKVPMKVGFVKTQHGPAMYSAIQIRRSDETGDNQGFLIMIQLLEEVFVTKLSQLTLTDVSYGRLPSPRDLQVLQQQNNYRIWDEDATHLSVEPFCYVILPDTNGDATSILTMKHSIGKVPDLLDEQSSIFVILMSLCIYMLYCFVSYTVIIPVKKLALEIKKRDKSTTYTPLDERYAVSELASVSQNMNQLMSTVHEQKEILIQQAKTDQLTQILNRRGLMDELKRHKDLCIRKKIGFVLIMADIDYFKQYNDSLGHIEGDIALQKVANLLDEQCKRIGDVCARYGGEEFTLLYSEMSEDNLQRKLKGIIHAMHKMAVPHPASLAAEHITISLGALIVQASDVVDYKLPSDELFSVADLALYAAKEAGRNGFVIKYLNKQQPID